LAFQLLIASSSHAGIDAAWQGQAKNPAISRNPARRLLIEASSTDAKRVAGAQI